MKKILLLILITFFLSLTPMSLGSVGVSENIVNAQPGQVPGPGGADPALPTPATPTPATPTPGAGADPCAAALAAVGLSPACWWATIKQGLAVAIITIPAVLLYFAGTVLNGAIGVSIIGMAEFVSQVKVVEDIWTTFRDFGNLVFIFLLVYTAVNTIIGRGGNMKETVAKIIIIAVLINFSLFFTKVIIDTGNIVTLQFYKAMLQNPEQQGQGGIVARNFDSGISWVFMSQFNLPSFLNPNPGDAVRQGRVAGAGATPGRTVADQAKDVEQKFRDSLGNNLSIAVMAAILFLIVAFIFFMIAILLIIRLVTLIFLMVTSPLAYVGGLLPKTSDLSKKWWHMLMNQVIFAPVLFMFLWVTARIINSPGFKTVIYGGPESRGDLSVALAGGIPDTVVALVGFALIATFLIASVVASRSMGAMGADFATKWAGKLSFGLAGAAGRQTIGRAASKISTNDRVKDFLSNSKVNKYSLGLGNTTLKGIKNTASGSFDVRASKMGALAGAIPGVSLGQAGGEGGYQKMLETQTKQRAEYNESLGYNKTKVHEQQQIIKENEDLKAQRISQMRLINPNVTQQQIDADPQVVQFINLIKDAKKKQGEIKVARQREYSATINTRSKDTIWTKIARKNKISASKIDIELAKKDIENYEKDLNEIKPEIRELEKKQRAANPNAVPPVFGLNATEQADLNELLQKRDRLEKSIREKKLDISNLERIQ